MSQAHTAEAFDVVVIGGGQAGLAAGNELARLGLRFVILDAHEHVGDAWRARWDSLRVFTPAWYDGLPGIPFPAPPHSFPGKDAVADYLAAYATTKNLPVRNGHAVDELRPADDGPGYLVRAGERLFRAGQVVVATGAYHHPFIPDFASQLDPGIRQLHSRDYRNPGQLQAGGVLVVGASNSGAEIAADVAADHRTFLAGRDVGELPFDTEGRVGRLLDPLIIFGATHLLVRTNRFGRKAIAAQLAHGTPVERARRATLESVGVVRVPGRAVGVRSGLPVLAGDVVVEVANVIWATGYRPDFSWIRLPITDDAGWPIQERGIVRAAPGLYFLGLPFMHSMTSALIGGVGRDAAYLAPRIAAHARVAMRAPADPLPSKHAPGPPSPVEAG